jgi:hypothetical protein
MGGGGGVENVGNAQASVHCGPGDTGRVLHWRAHNVSAQGARKAVPGGVSGPSCGLCAGPSERVRVCTWRDACNCVESVCRALAGPGSGSWVGPWTGPGTHFRGCRASSMMGMMLVRFLAMLIRSRPDRCENSTAYTMPVCSMRQPRAGGEGGGRGVHTYNGPGHAWLRTHTLPPPSARNNMPTTRHWRAGNHPPVNPPTQPT